MKLTAGIYDPYLDTLGGGERYCLTLAEILIKNGYQVDLFWSGDPNIIKLAEARFNLNLSAINIKPDIFNAPSNNLELVEDPSTLSQVTSHHLRPPSLLNKITAFFTKIKTTQKYDLIFFLSDWSIPFLFSKNNLLHLQVPLKTNYSLKQKLLNLVKLLFIRKIICNSHFTYKIASSYFGSKCLTVYPPIDTAKFDPTQTKSNTIISVGRFDDILNIKKQDVIIEAFKKFITQNNQTDWRLVLAGGSLEAPEKNSYLQHLQHLGLNLPIEFVVNPTFTELKELYATAKIYWHAAGYQVDESLHPEHTEHFGMTPVEAMASGLVPLLVKKGGLPEIITDGVDGYLWTDPSELVAKTQLLIASPDTLTQMAQAAIVKSQSFSKDNFQQSLSPLF